MTGGAWTTLRPALPLLVWGGHFTAIYALHAVACERGLDAAFVRLGVALATLAALGALALLFRQGALPALDGPEPEPEFRRWLIAAFALAAGVAVLFQALPGFVLPVC